MISRQHRQLALLLAVGLASYGFAACSSTSTPDTTTGGSATGGSPSQGGSTGGVQTTGGVVSTGGTTGGFATGGFATGGTTGGVATGGTATGGVATGGVMAGGAATGGTTAGGSSSGGSSKGGGGGSHTGGAGGGAMGSGGSGKGGNTGGSTTGGGATTGGSGGGNGTCQKGQVKASEVVIMGESFYAIAPQYIQKRIQDNARKAGSLGANESYRNVAVSGQNMNYIATTEWTAATQGGASVKFVIMDGGGIDCLGGGCSGCSNTFKTLLGKMATAGVQDVIYTRYPEPGAPPGSNASLKSCLDSTMPGMQTTCEASTSPRCHWVDLRPVWVAGDTTDGLHPTQSGGDHVGDLIWSEMVKLCLAQ